VNFTVEPEKEFKQVPMGTYTAKLNKIEERPPTVEKPEWGPSYMFEFMVMDPGEHHGESVACFTPIVPKTNNGLGKLLRGMLGRPLQPGEPIDGAKLIGQLFTISVDLNQTGKRTKVVNAVPAKAYPGPIAAAPVAPPAPPAPSAPPAPPAAQKLAAALGASPAAPAPAPYQKQYVQNRDCFRDQNRWCHYAGPDGLSKESRILELKVAIADGRLVGSDVRVYLPESAEWMPWAAVDLPF